MRKVLILLAMIALTLSACKQEQKEKKRPAKKEVIPEGTTDADREEEDADTLQRRD